MTDHRAEAERLLAAAEAQLSPGTYAPATLATIGLGYAMLAAGTPIADQHVSEPAGPAREPSATSHPQGTVIPDGSS